MLVMAMVLMMMMVVAITALSEPGRSPVGRFEPNHIGLARVKALALEAEIMVVVVVVVALEAVMATTKMASAAALDMQALS